MSKTKKKKTKKLFIGDPNRINHSEKFHFNQLQFDIISLCIITFCFFVQLLCCQYNIITPDEPHLLSIANSMCQGDGLLSDILHPASLFSVLLYIPDLIYRSLNNSNEGLLLTMRVLFCIVQYIISTSIYFLLRENRSAATFCGIILMFIFPSRGMYFSYYTIGPMSVILFLSLIYSQQEKIVPIKMFLCGFLGSLIALCTPYAIILYLYCLFLFLLRNLSKKLKHCYPFLSPKAFAFFNLGIIPMLVLFLFLVFRNSNFEEIKNCFPLIFGDPEYFSQTYSLLFNPIVVFLKNFITPGSITFILVVILIIRILIDKNRICNRKKHIANCTIIFSVYFAVAIIKIYVTQTAYAFPTMEYVLFSLGFSLIGLCSYILCNYKNPIILFGFFSCGLLYTFIIALSSNTGSYTQYTGYLMCIIGTFLSVRQLYHELHLSGELDFLLKRSKTYFQKTNKLFSILCLSIILIHSVVLFSTNFRANEGQLKITEGSCKGLYEPTKNEMRASISGTSKDIQLINSMGCEEDRLFVCDMQPTAYLDSSMKVGFFSAWYSGYNLVYQKDNERIISYYTFLPDNIPDYVYIPKSNSLQNTEQLLNTINKMFSGKTLELDYGYLKEVDSFILK